MDILVFSAVILFIAYIGIAIIEFGIPESISNTFYLYNEQKKGLGYVFTIFMITEGFLMVTPMLHIASGEWWQFFGFLCPSGLVLCGCAPLFKDEDVVKVHYLGAITSAVTGLTWCFLADTQLSLIVSSLVASCVIFFSIYTKSENACKTFWIEMFSFGTIAIVLLVLSLVSIQV